MIDLIQKDVKLNALLDLIPETSKGTLARTLINKAIEKAYKAGIIQFNQLTHEAVWDGKETLWNKICDDPFLEKDKILLINTYLKENGYD